MRMNSMAALIPALLLLACSSLPAQAPGEGDAKAVGEAIEGLRKAHKEKVDQDQIHFLKILATRWGAADPKQRKEILDLAEKSVKARSMDVKEAAVEAVAQMGGGEKERDAERATKILADEADKKPTEENITYFSHVVASIGRLRHPKGIPILTKLLKYKDYDIVATAALALAQYREAAIDAKKEIVGELLKIYTSAASEADDPRDTTAKARHEKIKLSMESALKALTNQQEVSGADSWWRWWQETGKKAKSW